MSRRKLPGKWIDNKDGSKSWRLPYRDGNTGKQSSKHFKTKGDAEAFYDDLQHGTKTKTWVAPDAGRETFQSFAQEWAATQDWTPSTQGAFAASLKRLVRMIGEQRSLDAVDELLLGKVRKQLVDEYAHRTAKVSFHYACAVMRAAYRLRKVPHDVTKTLKAPVDRAGKANDVGPDDVPTRAEVIALLDAASIEWRAAIALGASGLRVSEVLGVHAEQYDRETGELKVDRQLSVIEGVASFPLPKRDKVRTILLPDWAREALNVHMDEVQGGGLLFRSKLGEARRRDVFYKSVWWPVLIEAGIGARRYKFHSLRHWCASAMLAEGTPITAVAGHLGDTVETVSRTYAHWLREDRDVPAAVLSRMLRPQLEVLDEVG